MASVFVSRLHGGISGPNQRLERTGIEQRIRELQLLQRQLQAMLQQEPRQSFADQLCPLLGDEAEPLT